MDKYKIYINFIFSSSFGTWRGNASWEDNNNKRNSWVGSGVMWDYKKISFSSDLYQKLVTLPKIDDL